MKSKYNQLLALPAIGAFAFTISSAQAAITLIDTGSYTATSGGGFVTLDSTGLGGFDANGADKLLVSVNGERNGASGSGDVVSITYGGVSLTRVVTAAEVGTRAVSIWYADNITVSGDLVINTNNARGVGVGAIALGNTEDGLAGFSDTAITGQSLDTTAGGFVYAAAYNNGGSVPVTGDLTQLFSGDTGSSGGGAGYTTGTGTSLNLASSFTGEINYVGVSVLETIPEPSTSLLMGLGSIALLMRRRR